MVTFTYRDGVRWQPYHLAAFWHRVRQWYRRNRIPLRYTWTMELTARGRPHYHALLWVPRHLMLPTPDKRGWWAHGMTRTEVARNAVGYLAKYASKGSAGYVDGNGDTFRYPRYARISGGSGLDAVQAVEWRYWIAPKWARDRCEGVTDLRKVTGGYLAVATGELHPSPWRFVGVSPDGRHLLFEPRGV
jgi:hypothetical protein